MSFAEVFLRLGTALVAWMVIYAYFLWMAILRQVGCNADGDELYRLLMGMAPVAIGFSVLLRSTRPMHEVHSVLRWLSLPLVLLVPAALLSAWQVLQSATFAGQGICSPDFPSSWHYWWAPLQIAAALTTSYMVYRIWSSVAKENVSESGG